jgi:hypothetical protein
MPLAGLEPATPASDRPQTLVLNRSAIRIGGFEPAIPAGERLQTYTLDHMAISISYSNPETSSP